MKKLLMMLIVIALAGCGAADFNHLYGDAPPLSDDGVTPMAHLGTGGHATIATGGGSGALLGSGGSTEATGTGGRPEGSGGSHEVGDACVLVTHDNGVGQTWQDCVPLDTWDESQALKACAAWCLVNGGCTCANGPLCDDHREMVFARSDKFLEAWDWQGPIVGEVTQLNLQATQYTCGVGVGAWD